MNGEYPRAFLDCTDPLYMCRSWPLPLPCPIVCPTIQMGLDGLFGLLASSRAEAKLTLMEAERAVARVQFSAEDESGWRPATRKRDQVL